MKNKICLITGGNSGIGFAAAKGLAIKGNEVVIISRNKERGEAAIASLISETKKDNISLIVGDLASLKSIKNVAETFLSKYDRLDVLINNAGGIAQTRKETLDGFEYTIGVNHLGHFYLTQLLQKMLIQTPNSKIVSISSLMQNRVDLDFDDFMFKNAYHPVKAYGRSKLCNLLFSAELAQRMQGTGVTAYAVDPGIVSTNISNTLKGTRKWVMNALSFFANSPDKGADSIVWLASTKVAPKFNGQLIKKRKITKMNPAANDADIRKQLWQLSEQLIAQKTT